MAAVHSDELKRMVQQYIDGDREVVDKLKSVLESTSVGIRLSLIENVEAVDYSEWNILHTSAWGNDVEMMKRLLHEFSSDQMWQVLVKDLSCRDTPLYVAACKGSTEAAKYLLESTPHQFRWECLTITDWKKDTVLHHAAKSNHLGAAKALLSFLSPAQQFNVLLMRNGDRQSVDDILSTKYPQGLEVAEQKLRNELAEQKVEHDREMKAMKVEHDKEIKTLTDKLAEQKVEHDREMQAMKEKQAELDRKLAQLDVYLHQTNVTSDVGDQETPHSD